jgi:hypothetical protein
MIINACFEKMMHYETVDIDKELEETNASVSFLISEAPTRQQLAIRYSPGDVRYESCN